MRPHFRTALLGALAFAAPPVARGVTPRFEIRFSSAVHTGPITGRLVLFLAKSDPPQPRLQLSPRGPALFAIDVDQLGAAIKTQAPAGENTAAWND